MGNARAWIRVFCAVSLAGSTPALSQSRGILEDFDTQAVAKGTVSILNDGLFGDTVELSTGATSILVTDVSLPGNNDLPVALQRRFLGNDNGVSILEWSEYEIPYLSGLYRRSSGWQGNYPGHPEWRCSNGQAPEVGQSSGKEGLFDANEYWHGVTLNLPGGGSEFMKATSSAYPGFPQDGNSYRWATRSRWYFSCLPATANGVSGESFLARSPDGKKYYFDWIVRWGAASAISKESSLGLAVLSRDEYRIYPTRIEDRFGNWVKYSYSSQKLIAIDSSDGRKLTITYDPVTARLSSVFDGVHRWTYDYTSGIKVNYPDGTYWKATPSGIGISRLSQSCDSNTPPPRYSGESVITIEHPSGAVGQFRFTPLRIGTSFVPYGGASNPSWCGHRPNVTDNIALASKSISGPGIATQTWTYTYGPANECFVYNGSGTKPVPECAIGAPTTRIVEVAGPGLYQRYTFGNKFRETEGALLKLEQGASTTSIIQTEQMSWSFLSPVDGSTSTMLSTAGDNYLAILPRVLDSKAITRDGVSFLFVVDERDNRGRPTRVTRSNSLGF